MGAPIPTIDLLVWGRGHATVASHWDRGLVQAHPGLKQSSSGPACNDPISHRIPRICPWWDAAVGAFEEHKEANFLARRASPGRRVSRTERGCLETDPLTPAGLSRSSGKGSLPSVVGWEVVEWPCLLLLGTKRSGHFLADEVCVDREGSQDVGRSHETCLARQLFPLSSCGKKQPGRRHIPRRRHSPSAEEALWPSQPVGAAPFGPPCGPGGGSSRLTAEDRLAQVPNWQAFKGALQHSRKPLPVGRGVPCRKPLSKASEAEAETALDFSAGGSRGQSPEGAFSQVQWLGSGLRRWG